MKNSIKGAIAAGIVVAVVTLLVVVSGLFYDDSAIREIKALTVQDIKSIELVSQASSINEMYKKYTQEEFASIMEQIIKPCKKVTTNPKAIVGKTDTFYITTNDYKKHIVTNYANKYLIIDKQFYNADCDLLKQWDFVGDSPIPTGFFDKANQTDNAYRAESANEVFNIHSNALLLGDHVTITCLTPEIDPLQQSDDNLRELKIDDIKLLDSDVRKNKAVYTISIKVDQGLKLGGDWEPKVRNYTLYLEKSGKRWYVESCVAKAKSEEVLKQWWKEKPFKNSKGQDEDIVFDGITNELKAYPYDYGSKDAKEDGLVCSSAMGTDNIEDLDSFIKSTSAGRKDEITIWSYGTDSGPFFTKIIYDGERYFAVFDHTRDTFGPRGYEKGVYTYLKQLEYETESTKPHTCVVLTDNKDLDYEKYREEINLRQTFLIIDYEK